jgi:hypothetical protein
MSGVYEEKDMKAQIAILQAQIVQRQRMINILTQMITLQDKAREVQKEMDKERRMENESKEGESAKKKRRIGGKEENDEENGVPWGEDGHIYDPWAY